MTITNPGFYRSSITYIECSPNKKRCIVKITNHYLELTNNLRATDHLIFIYKKTRKAVSTNRNKRGCKTILGKVGIDIERYLSHSTRSPSASKVKSVDFH